jgi:hypothetical protein
VCVQRQEPPTRVGRRPFPNWNTGWGPHCDAAAPLLPLLGRPLFVSILRDTAAGLQMLLFACLHLPCLGSPVYRASISPSSNHASIPGQARSGALHLISAACFGVSSLPPLPLPLMVSRSGAALFANDAGDLRRSMTDVVLPRTYRLHVLVMMAVIRLKLSIACTPRQRGHVMSCHVMHAVPLDVTTHRLTELQSYGDRPDGWLPATSKPPSPSSSRAVAQPLPSREIRN